MDQKPDTGQESSGELFSHIPGSWAGSHGQHPAGCGCPNACPGAAPAPVSFGTVTLECASVQAEALWTLKAHNAADRPHSARPILPHTKAFAFRFLFFL